MQRTIVRVAAAQGKWEIWKFIFPGRGRICLKILQICYSQIIYEVLKNKGYTKVFVGCCNNLLAFIANFELKHLNNGMRFLHQAALYLGL